MEITRESNVGITIDGVRYVLPGVVRITIPLTERANEEHDSADD